MSTNPWNLTDRQCEVLAALVESGCCKVAARRLNVTGKTVEVHMERIRAKMGLHHSLRAAVLFDRWQREARA